uniref:ELYS domain-containing protein n=1 Tax=Strongyloides venezuelensis TaxID=75913 RepID=A0A0K0EXS3_STRVS
MLEEWCPFDYIQTKYTSMPKDKRIGLGRLLAAYYINLELAWPLENLPSLLSWNDKVIEGSKNGLLEIIDRKMFVNVLSLGYEPGVAVIILLKESHHLEVMYFLSHFMDVRSDLIIRLLLDNYNITKKTIAENFFIARLYNLIDICIENYRIVETIKNNSTIKDKIKQDALQFTKSVKEIEKIFDNNIILTVLNYSSKAFEKLIKSQDSPHILWNYYKEEGEPQIDMQLNQKLYFIFNILMNLSFDSLKLHEFLDILEIYLKINFKTVTKEPLEENIKEDGKLKIEYDVLEKVYFSDKIISIFLDIFLLFVQMEYRQNFKENYENGNKNESKTLLKEIYKLFGEEDSSINCLKLAIQNSGKFCEIAHIVLKMCKKIGKEKVMSNNDREINECYEESVSLRGGKNMLLKSSKNLSFKCKESMKNKPPMEIRNNNAKLQQFSYNLGIHNLYSDILNEDMVYKHMHFISEKWTIFPLMSSGLIPLKINLEPKLFFNLLLPEEAVNHQDIMNALNISTDFKSHDVLIGKIAKTLNLVKKTVEEVENRKEKEKNELVGRYNNSYNDDEIVSKINNHAIEDAAMMINRAKNMAIKSVARERSTKRDTKKQIDLKNSFKSKILEITVSKDDIFPEIDGKMINDKDNEKDIVRKDSKIDIDNVSSYGNIEESDKRIEGEIKIIDKINSLFINKDKVIISSNNTSNAENNLSSCRMKRRVKRIRKNNINKSGHSVFTESSKSYQQPNRELTNFTISSLSSSPTSQSPSSMIGKMKQNNYPNENKLVYPTRMSINIGPKDLINDYHNTPKITPLDLRSISSPSPEIKKNKKKIVSPIVRDSYSQTTTNSLIFIPFSKNISYEYINTRSEQQIPMSTRSEFNTKNLPTTTSTTIIPDWLCMLPLDSSRNLYSTRVLTIKDRNLLKEIKNKGFKYGLKKRKDFDSGFNDDIYNNN